MFALKLLAVSRATLLSRAPISLRSYSFAAQRYIPAFPMTELIGARFASTVKSKPKAKPKSTRAPARKVAARKTAKKTTTRKTTKKRAATKRRVAPKKRPVGRHRITAQAQAAVKAVKAAAKAVKASKLTPKKEKIYTEPPKSFLPPYVAYFKTIYDRGNPDLHGQARAAGAKWRSLTEAEKRPFHDAFEADKERYHKEFAAWKASLSTKALKQYNHDLRIRRDRRTLKAGGGVSRPVMPFIHFIKEFHLDPVNATGLTAGSKWGPEMAKRAGEKWRSMSDAEKAPFITLSDHSKRVWEAAKERQRVVHEAEKQAKKVAKEHAA